MLTVDQSKLEGLDPEVRQRVQAELAELQGLVEKDPLQGFWPHSQPQLEFMEARTPVQAAFAGNRFGKTTALVVKALIQCIPANELPKKLRRFKVCDGPTFGRVVCPERVANLYGVIIPAFRKWCPPGALQGGSFDKAWSKEFRTLHFTDGSWIQGMTYEMDVSSFGGAAMHFVAYDEPPPAAIRRECVMRLIDYSGFEMFSCTPLRVNTGWMRRDIWKKREAPDVTVIKASIHDNPLLGKDEKERALSAGDDSERRAREFGDFLDFGGLIYPDFEASVLKKPPDLDFVRKLDIVVGIDPGIRNAGFVWVGFDQELQAWVFNEGLLQNKEAPDYVEFIKAENDRLGLRSAQISYVCDPTARSRGQVSAETVMNALINLGIPCNAGQNDHAEGFGQMRSRMRHERFHVWPTCRGLRDEADDYAAKEPEEGKDDSHLEPIRGNDHRLDACRYAVMERPWDALLEAKAPERNLGWEPGKATPARYLQPARESAPMGSMS